MPRDDQRQLPWDRDGTGGAVGLGRQSVALPVDLVRKRDLRVVELVEADIGPGEPAELGHACAGKRGDGEQHSVGLSGGSERLLNVIRAEQRPETQPMLVPAARVSHHRPFLAKCVAWSGNRELVYGGASGSRFCIGTAA